MFLVLSFFHVSTKATKYYLLQSIHMQMCTSLGQAALVSIIYECLYMSDTCLSSVLR
jgi:hypothetical protein